MRNTTTDTINPLNSLGPCNVCESLPWSGGRRDPSCPCTPSQLASYPVCAVRTDTSRAFMQLSTCRRTIAYVAALTVRRSSSHFDARALFAPSVGANMLTCMHMYAIITYRVRASCKNSRSQMYRECKFAKNSRSSSFPGPEPLGMLPNNG